MLRTLPSVILPPAMLAKVRLIARLPIQLTRRDVIRGEHLPLARPHKRFYCMSGTEIDECQYRCNTLTTGGDVFNKLLSAAKSDNGFRITCLAGCGSYSNHHLNVVIVIIRVDPANFIGDKIEDIRWH